MNRAMMGIDRLTPAPADLEPRRFVKWLDFIPNSTPDLPVDLIRRYKRVRPRENRLSAGSSVWNPAIKAAPPVVAHNTTPGAPNRPRARPDPRAWAKKPAKPQADERRPKRRRARQGAPEQDG